MITDMTIMLYVDDVNRHSNFWQKVGFEEALRQTVAGYETSLLIYSETGAAFQLYERAYIQETQPEAVLTHRPDVLFSAPYIDEIYEKLVSIGATVSEITPYGDQYAFTFTDPDGSVYTLLGGRIDVPLDEENGAEFDRNISQMIPLTAQDLEKLEEPAYIFFGRKTCPWTRHMARSLATISRKIYFVDTENTKSDFDLHKAREFYGVVTVPTLIKRASNGMFVKFDKEKDTIKHFFREK